MEHVGEVLFLTLRIVRDQFVGVFSVLISNEGMCMLRRKLDEGHEFLQGSSYGFSTSTVLYPGGFFLGSTRYNEEPFPALFF